VIIELKNIETRIDAALKPTATIDQKIATVDQTTAGMATTMARMATTLDAIAQQQATAEASRSTRQPLRILGFLASEFIAAVLSIFLLGISAYVAYASRVDNWPEEYRKFVGYFVVGGWALGPPLYLWADWIWYARYLKGEDLENMKYTHEVSRNIWLAVVVALAAAYDIKWPGE
jgi:hypothetical protein